MIISIDPACISVSLVGSRLVLRGGATRDTTSGAIDQASPSAPSPLHSRPRDAEHRGGGGAARYRRVCVRDGASSPRIRGPDRTKRRPRSDAAHSRPTVIDIIAAQCCLEGGFSLAGQRARTRIHAPAWLMRLLFGRIARTDASPTPGIHNVVECVRTTPGRREEGGGGG